eukprot:UN26657
MSKKVTDANSSPGANNRQYHMKPFCFFQDEALDEEFFAICWCTWDSDLYIIAAGNLALIKVFNLTERKSVRVVEGHGDQINEINCHPTKFNIVATASKDMSVRIYDVKNSRCLFICNHHVSNVLTVNWNIQGTLLVSGAMDNSVAVWNMKTLDKIIASNRPRHQPKITAAPKYITKWLHRNYVDSV